MNMIPMSSRRRAVSEFSIECSLFVNQKALYNITGMTKYYIKSASATMLGTRRRRLMAFIGFRLYFMTIEARLCVSLLSKFWMAGLLSYFWDCYCKNGA
jgi:hypothetical protein